MTALNSALLVVLIIVVALNFEPATDTHSLGTPSLSKNIIVERKSIHSMKESSIKEIKTGPRKEIQAKEIKNEDFSHYDDCYFESERYTGQRQECSVVKCISVERFLYRGIDLEITVEDNFLRKSTDVKIWSSNLELTEDPERWKDEIYRHAAPQILERFDCIPEKLLDYDSDNECPWSIPEKSMMEHKYFAQRVLDLKPQTSDECPF